MITRSTFPRYSLREFPDDGKSIWTRFEFPTLDVDIGHNHETFLGRDRVMFGRSDHWRASARKPFTWTPTKPFWFGGKQFIALYPCAAFESVNFGYVIQKKWDGLISARE